MPTKEAEDFLSRYRFEKRYLQRLEDAAQLDSTFWRTQQALLKKWGMQPSAEINNFVEALQRREERERAATREAIADIEATISAVRDDTQRAALELHYIKGLTWEDVAQALQYSYSQIHRIRRAALSSVTQAKENECPTTRPARSAVRT